VNRRALVGPPVIESDDGGLTWSLVTTTHLWCGHPRWGTRTNRLAGLPLAELSRILERLGYSLPDELTLSAQ
jgi:hypothetical protein